MIRIGSLEVDLERRQLLLDGAALRVGSRAFDILALLIEAQGELVSKDDLLRRVWPDTVVEENNLPVHLSRLRVLLGESRVLLQTISGRGYRLVGAKTQDGSSVPSPKAPGTIEAQCGHVVPNNLPSSVTELIGRDGAIDDIIQALRVGRHVTLIGAGGIGKTRLAVEVAHRLLKSFPDGVYLISLASTTDYGSVLDAVSSALGLNSAAGALSLAHIGEELGERRMLFVLDNCEQVIGPAAELAESLAGISDWTRVIATSREPLKVVSEHVYWVEPLHVPAQSDSRHDVLQCSAVQLFLSRARALDTLFLSDERSNDLISTICRRLDGIPLAIELAAARATTLGVETLATRLDDRFHVLTGGNRSALPRHQTLRATFDWSYALLDEAERVTLRRLGIFSAGFTMPAVIAVVADGLPDEYAIVAAVSGLVEKSLVMRPTGGNRLAYRLLETTCAYAQEKLDDNGERRSVMFRFTNYLTGLLGDVSCPPAPRGSELWQRNMRELLDDLRAALTWAFSPHGDSSIGETLAVRFVWLLFELSLVDECCAWARRSLEALQDRPDVDINARRLKRVRMHLQAALAAALVYVQGPDNKTSGIWSEILSSAIACGDQNLEACALWGMWNACQSAGDAHGAVSFARRFAALATHAGHASPVDGSPGITDPLLGHRIVGIALHYAGDQHEAYAAFQQFLPHAHALRAWMPLGRLIDQYVVGNATFARVLWMRGERDEALQLTERCIAEARIQEQAIVTCHVLIEAGVPLALLSGEGERAAQAIGMLHEISTRVGLNVAQACSRAFDAYLLSLGDASPERLREFSAALGSLDALGFGAPSAMLVAQYALSLGRAGWHDEAITTVARALKRCEETGSLWFASELYRIQGELLTGESPGLSDSLATSVVADAERCFIAALDVSARQGAASLQLRAAVSLARLLSMQGHYARARDVLEPVCALFPGGRDWPDYREAIRLLITVQEVNDAEGTTLHPETAR